MLEACHERVERMLGLLKRLKLHLNSQGCDDQAKQAAKDVMRYFDLAAPLHHQDEELHVFPVVLQSPPGPVHDAVHALLRQHCEQEVVWTRLRANLQSLVLPFPGTDSAALDAETVNAFCEIYDTHMRLEEEVVYPVARKAFDQAQLRVAGLEMMKRRGVAVLLP